MSGRWRSSCCATATRRRRDELRDHLAQEYAKWQLPDRYEFIDEIPRTATGKFKKTALREQFAPAKV